MDRSTSRLHITFQLNYLAEEQVNIKTSRVSRTISQRNRSTQGLYITCQSSYITVVPSTSGRDITCQSSSITMVPSTSGRDITCQSSCITVGCVYRKLLTSAGSWTPFGWWWRYTACCSVTPHPTINQSVSQSVHSIASFQQTAVYLFIASRSKVARWTARFFQQYPIPLAGGAMTSELKRPSLFQQLISQAQWLSCFLDLSLLSTTQRHLTQYQFQTSHQIKTI